MGTPGLPSYSYTHLSGALTTQLVFPAPVILHAVVVNTAGTSVTLFDTADPTATSGRTVLVIGATASTFIYDLQLIRGLVVTTVGAGTDLTLMWGPTSGDLNLVNA